MEGWNQDEILWGEGVERPTPSNQMIDTEPVQQPFFDTQSFLWQRKNLDFIEWKDLILRSPKKLVAECRRERNFLTLNSSDQEVFIELGVAVELPYPLKKAVLIHCS